MAVSPSLVRVMGAASVVAAAALLVAHLRADRAAEADTPAGAQAAATRAAAASPAPAPAPSPAPAPRPAPAPAPRFTFAVLSDLHLSAVTTDQPPVSAQRMIAALIATHPRFVVITGDLTNGTITDVPGQVHFRVHAWRAIRKLLAPLRAAGIPVLPVAGNHDSYLPGQRRLYAEAFADLDAWAAPFVVHARPQPPADPRAGRDADVDVGAAPFTYSVDVDGVHLALAHIVDQHVAPEVGDWLTGDLAGAAGARLRLVFGHVPIASVMTRPKRKFLDTFGAILAGGHADAYVAGHEHMVWDEDVALPGGVPLRQILVGTATGRYDYGPSKPEQARAGCVRRGLRMECHLPIGGEPFEMRPNSHRDWIEDQRATFTLLTVDGGEVIATPVGVGKDGRLAPFGTAAR